MRPIAAKAGFATLPYERALGFGLRYANLPCAILAADFVDVRHQVLDFGDRAIEFHQQQRATVGIICVHRGLGGLDRQIVHHFDRGGEHARGNDVTDRCAGFVGGGECREERVHALWTLHDAQDHFCGDSQRAFGADENSGEIVARRVQGFPAKMYKRSIGEHDLQPENMRRGESVFQAMRAAGIFRDVAADAADRLR